MTHQPSFDEDSNYYSFLSSESRGSEYTSIKDLIYNSYSFIQRYIVYLAPIDQAICRFYYIDHLSQIQIAKLFNICQAAVSRRLKFIFDRLKFLIKMPSFNPVQIRTEFRKLFPPDLFEYAFYFYFEFAQNRVKYFTETSQSGSANRLFQILSYLENLAKTADATSEPTDQQYLALIYLEYFRFISQNSNILSLLYKKHDVQRAQAFYKGDSVLEFSDIS